MSFVIVCEFGKTFAFFFVRAHVADPSKVLEHGRMFWFLLRFFCIRSAEARRMTVAEVLEIQEKARAHKSQTQAESFNMSIIALLAELVLSQKAKESEKAANA